MEGRDGVVDLLGSWVGEPRTIWGEILRWRRGRPKWALRAAVVQT